MGQVFPASSNAVAKAVIAVGLVLIVGLVYVKVQLGLSRWETREQVHIQQPVPFSHEHHVSGLGIDCRYCHNTVEVSSSAGMPAVHTCMSCHSQIWTEAPVLEPVRRSYQTEQPIIWERVYDLPDYVYFDHSIHVNKGVACETCHGRVDQMPLMYKANELHMSWCLDCHRHPERYIRPRELVYTFGHTLPKEEQVTLGRKLIDAYDIRVEQLTDCSICHR